MEQITIFTRGSAKSDPGPAAIGVQIVGADGKVLKEVAEAIGNATNNYAEYFSVIRSLQTAEEMFGEKTKELQFELKLDSELVKKQLNGETQIKDVGLVGHFIEVHNMRVASFPNLKLTHIRRKCNKEAERLVNEVLDA